MFGLNQLHNQFKLNITLYCTLPLLAGVLTPNQHMYWPEYYYPAGHYWLVLHYYSCHAVQYYALSDPVLAGYINKSNLRLLLSLQPAAILKT